MHNYMQVTLTQNLILTLKAKVYLILYVYVRDSVQCAWCEFRLQNSTRVLYAHPRILCTRRSHMRIKLSCSN